MASFAYVCHHVWRTQAAWKKEKERGRSRAKVSITMTSYAKLRMLGDARKPPDQNAVCVKFICHQLFSNVLLFSLNKHSVNKSPIEVSTPDLTFYRVAMSMLNGLALVQPKVQRQSLGPRELTKFGYPIPTLHKNVYTTSREPVKLISGMQHYLSPNIWFMKNNFWGHVTPPPG